jgi:hypothetical protein
MFNLTRKSRIATAAVVALVLLAPAVALAAINWQITLGGSHAYPAANGSAQYQSQPGQREIQVEVQRVRALAGKKVTFSAAGMTLGSATVSPRGQADITRNTEFRQVVPPIMRGSVVSVRTAGGQLVASGRF